MFVLPPNIRPPVVLLLQELKIGIVGSLAQNLNMCMVLPGKFPYPLSRICPTDGCSVEFSVQKHEICIDDSKDGDCTHDTRDLPLKIFSQLHSMPRLFVSLHQFPPGFMLMRCVCLSKKHRPVVASNFVHHDEPT